MLHVTVTIIVIYFERYSKVLNICRVFSHQSALPLPSPIENANVLFKRTHSVYQQLFWDIFMLPSITNIGYTLYFLQIFWPKIIWLHSCGSGFMLKELIYEIINFCGIYFFEFTPQVVKMNSAKLCCLLWLVFLQNVAWFPFTKLNSGRFFEKFNVSKNEADRMGVLKRHSKFQS